MEERRRDVRIPLDEICYALVYQQGQPDLNCILLDVSQSGARVGLPADEVHPQIGARVILHVKSPIKMVSLNNHWGTVVWSGGVQLGMLFDEAVDFHL